jgi:ribosome biogenesis GTPase
MYQEESGGFILDNLGIRVFELVEIEKELLAHYFPEMRRLLVECKFQNNMFVNEHHCAVKDAVANGEIDPALFVPPSLMKLLTCTKNL